MGMGSTKWLGAATVLLSTLSTLSTVAEASTGARLPLPSPIAVGYTHTLLLKPTGKLYSWGNNTWGQLGITGGTSWHPAQVGLSNSAAMSAGDGFSFVVLTNGQLWGFGKNDVGQLGRGSTNTVANPTPVRVGTSQWRTVAAGKRHVLGIKWDGSLWGWGANGSGQLGLGNTTNRNAPTLIDSSRSWIAVSAGEDFSVAMRADGRVFTAGANGSGQLGRTGSTSSFLTVDDNKCWRVISAGGSHVLAVLDNGTLWTWGLNNAGQLGNGNTTNQSTPAQRGTGVWRTVSAGYRHSMGIAAAGTRYTWGDDADRGLGANSAGSRTTPNLGIEPTNSQYIAAGKAFGAKIGANGELKMWGRGYEGQLGTGSSTTVLATPAWPYQFAMDGFAFYNKLGVLAPGRRASAAIRSDGRLETWGYNVERQLGLPFDSANPQRVLVPTVIVSGNMWMDVAAGETQVVAIRGDGTLWGWGKNNLGESYGQQGPGTDTPIRIGVDLDWIKVTAHYSTTFALKADGRLFAFGDNAGGKIGDGDPIGPRYVPSEVIRPSGVGNRWVAMALSSKNGYGITSGGQLFAWGYNASGQLGIGSTDITLEQHVPVVVSADMRNWISVGAGQGYTIGLTGKGDLFGWGANDRKQLCRSTPSMSNLPFEIAAGTDWSAITVSHESFLVVGPSDAVRGCGSNSSGELGTGDYGSRPTGTGTVPANTTFYNPRHMVMGDGHTLLIDGYGHRMVAGFNGDGQLGTGNTFNQPYPTEISPGY
jgi:alpha-tubulin suppressor-like RCC1 family protein